MKSLRKLPVGIQSFKELRENDFLYIDKTEKIFELIEGSKAYFLSRPRRFGKSLLINTLKELFLGNKELFKGLWIEDKIEWKQYSVIHFDFAKGDYKEFGLRKYLYTSLQKKALQYQIELKAEGLGSQFQELIVKLHEKFNEQVVILIDEYDKPIIDFLSKSEIHQAVENRDIMKEFYSPVKGLDKYIRFFFLTGVSKFTKVSIFSELNHLQDLTLHRLGATLLGYTEAELYHYFADYIQFIASEEGISEEQLKVNIREWYNGYNFTGNEKVYNPFSVLNFMSSRKFNNYWFETGTPTFLVKMLAEDKIYDVDQTETDLLSLGNFNIENIDVVTVLFQTGYLTLQEQIEFDMYRLGYPNKEVKNSMLKMLLSEYGAMSSSETNSLVMKIKRAFLSANFEDLFLHFNTLFAKIPAEIFEERLESYYHSIVFLTFTLLGYYADAEVHTSRGRIDAVVQTKDAVFVLEFKIKDSAKSALQQIKDKQYHHKYLSEEKKIYLIGIACNQKEIKEYLIEEVN
jgi:hypothetical protein